MYIYKYINDFLKITFYEEFENIKTGKLINQKTIFIQNLFIFNIFCVSSATNFYNLASF